MSIEAMKRWREALLQASKTIDSFSVQHAAYAALRELDQAIEQAEQAQQPVAWLFTNLQSGDYDFCYHEDEHDHDREMWHRQPLYTAPPPRQPWVGLTDKEVKDCIASTAYNFEAADIARAIEAKLKEKNT